MVGGIVIGVAHQGEETLINVAGSGGGINDYLAIRVKGGAAIRPGDQVWWQGRLAMWTPQENIGREGLRCGVDYEIQLQRVGYSH